MLEIIFLVWFVKKLAAIATSKGRSPGWGGLGALFWIVGEITGLAIGMSMDLGAGGYLFALVGAGAAAVVAYVIVNSLGETQALTDVGPAGAPYDPSNPYSPPPSGNVPPRM
jgi:hypothetical protein